MQGGNEYEQVYISGLSPRRRQSRGTQSGRRHSQRHLRQRRRTSDLPAGSGNDRVFSSSGLLSAAHRLKARNRRVVQLGTKPERRRGLNRQPRLRRDGSRADGRGNPGLRKARRHHPDSGTGRHVAGHSGRYRRGPADGHGDFQLPAGRSRCLGNHDVHQVRRFRRDVGPGFQRRHRLRG